MKNRLRVTNHPRVTVDPDILSGVPVITGTRIPVCLILEMLEGGQTVKQILRQYPSLREDDVHAALHFSADLAAHP